MWSLDNKILATNSHVYWNHDSHDTSRSRCAAMRKTAGKNELVVDKMELQVFILTSGRVRRQKTIESLNCTSLWYKSVDLRIVIPRNEKTLWERVNPQWVDYLYCVNKNWRVEEIRQHILEKFSKNLHLVLDDDLTLYKKLEKRRWEKIKDSIAFLKHIRELLETYKHGSIASHASQWRTGATMRACTTTARPRSWIPPPS